MGCNYYAFDEEMKETEFCENGLHIGKNSWGWVFHFEAHSKPELKTVEQYREYLKDKFIYDEYDRLVFYDEFWEMVEETKEPMPDGREKYVLRDPTEEPSFITSELPMWEDEGFGFTEWEFC